MILPKLSDEKILAELLVDYSYVKKQMKKIASRFMNNAQKQRKAITNDDMIADVITSPNNNKWYITIEFTPNKKAPWYGRLCCVSESDRHTKDYYMVRGFSNDKPYYIKITSHTLKRMQERNYVNFKSMKIPSFYLVNYLFEPHETIVGTHYVDLKYHELISKMDDHGHIDTMQYIFTYFRGIFFGYKTPNGNVYFKTYIESSMAFQNLYKSKAIKSTDKQILNTYVLVFAHQYYNKRLYDKATLDSLLYREIGEDDEIDFEQSQILVLKP